MQIGLRISTYCACGHLKKQAPEYCTETEGDFDNPALQSRQIRALSLGCLHVGVPVELFLWKDDLDRCRVIRVGDGVAQNADCAHHLAGLGNLWKLTKEAHKVSQSMVQLSYY
jgi:hypothetical protein